MTTGRIQLKADPNHRVRCSCVCKCALSLTKNSSPFTRAAIYKPFPRTSGLISAFWAVVEICARQVGANERVTEFRPHYLGAVWPDCECRHPSSANDRSVSNNTFTTYGERK